MTSLARYARTLVHLRPVQIYGRIWHKLHRPRPDLRPAPPPRALPAWRGPHLRKPSLIGEATLRLLGDERTIAAASDWQHVHPTALWMYNLHYFEDLDAPGERAAWQHALLDRWLAQNPPGVGIGWDAYPTSLRMVSWIRWLLRGNAPRPGMLASLAVQARWLSQRLEHHLLGNHLFVNAKALVFVGAFFSGPEADGWLREGHRLLARELAEQLLDDGGHFERSPMYHALILEDVLDLIALGELAPAAEIARLRDDATRMVAWLIAMTHPDGELSLVNDATGGVAASTAALVAYASSLGIAAPSSRTADLAASGYTRLERDGAVLIADTGELGPSYLPAHGHADTLSFELSVRGRRILVDSGVSEYGTSAERVRQRGTAAHNTVVVDGYDSSEVWSGFRVGRRAHVHARAVTDTSIRAEHDGYRRVIHARAWRLDRGLVITDELRGAGQHRVEPRFHFALDVQPVQLGPHTWSLGNGIEIELDPRCTWRLVDGTLHPAMGVTVHAKVLAGSIETELPFALATTISW